MLTWSSDQTVDITTFFVHLLISSVSDGICTSEQVKIGAFILATPEQIVFLTGNGLPVITLTDSNELEDTETLNTYLIEHRLIRALVDAANSIERDSNYDLKQSEREYVDAINTAFDLLKAYTDDKHAQADEEYNELRESIARQIDLGHGLLEALKYPKDSPVFIWAQNAIDFLNYERHTERNKWPKYPYHVAASVLLPD